jgi:hypothetical protein
MTEDALALRRIVIERDIPKIGTRRRYINVGTTAEMRNPILIGDRREVRSIACLDAASQRSGGQSLELTSFS